MKRYFLTLSVMLFCCQFARTQKASDVIENGIRIKSEERIFFQYDKSVLQFDVAKSFRDDSIQRYFTPYEDSTIFLVTGKSIKIYLLPLNPLNFSYYIENKVVIDPIDEASTTALGSIVDVSETFDHSIPALPYTTEGNAGGRTNEPIMCEKFKIIETKIKLIQDKLSDDKKSKIIEIFKGLKALDFYDESNTIKDIADINIRITEIENHFSEIADLINETKNDVKNYDGDNPEVFMARFVLNSILKDMAISREQQKKRLDNLKASYNLVDAMKKKASKGDQIDKLSWCIELPLIPAKEGKISVCSIAIKESGYMLSAKDEIVSIGSKDILKRTIKVRKFQWLVPEIAIGTAYTFFKYNIYGTTSDSTGQQFIATPTKNLVHNSNIITMINFSYYIPNSTIHPIYQIGVGLNSGVPILLTGFGFRSNINGIKRLAISAGIAVTWLKELDKLKVGDKILGTDDIEKDLKYQFFWLPRPYIGLQYNF